MNSKVRFDRVARRLRIARRELRDLSRHIADDIDAQIVYEMATDLGHAARDCATVGLHQLGQGADLAMSYGHRADSHRGLAESIEVFGRPPE